MGHVKHCRVDANQSDIVKELRAHGCSVRSSANVGEGFPDIVVGRHGMTFIFEIKDPSKPPSSRKLTKDEIEFHNSWRGQCDVIHSAKEAIDIMDGHIKNQAVRKK